MGESVDSDDLMLGGGSAEARRRGDVVLRRARPWTSTVHSVLRFLEERGFEGAPRIAGTGFTTDGFETLTFIEGDQPPTEGLSQEGAFGLGALLRSTHDVLAGFNPTGAEQWMPCWVRSLPGENWIIGHCDVAPWNVICRDEIPVALIDWDSCGPVARMWDLAHAVWLNAGLFDDESAEAHGQPLTSERICLAARICDGYEVVRSDRELLVDAMIEVAVRTAAQESDDSGVSETASMSETEFTPNEFGLLGGGRPLEGRELTWALTWRIRSARWLMDNRTRLLEQLTKL
jgi:Phosphotransferase enzyme family